MVATQPPCSTAHTLYISQRQHSTIVHTTPINLGGRLSSLGCLCFLLKHRCDLLKHLPLVFQLLRSQQQSVSEAVGVALPCYCALVWKLGATVES